MAANVPNADGRLSMLMVGENNEVLHRSQDSTGVCSEWARLGSEEDRLLQLSAYPNKDGRISVFGIGLDYRPFHIWQVSPNGPFADRFYPLGGPNDRLTTIGPAMNENGCLSVFGLGTDGRAFHTYQVQPSGDFAAQFYPIGQPYDVFLKLAAAVNHDGRISLFGIRPDNRPCHVWQVNVNAQFTDRFVQLGSSGDRLVDLSAMPNLDGRISVFGIGTDSGVFHLWQLEQSGDFHNAFVPLDGWLSSMVTTRFPNGCIQITGTGAWDRNTYCCQQVAPNAPFGAWSLLEVVELRNLTGRGEFAHQLVRGLAGPGFAPGISSRLGESYGERAAEFRAACALAKEMEKQYRNKGNREFAELFHAQAVVVCKEAENSEKKAGQPVPGKPRNLDGQFHTPIKLPLEFWSC